MQGENTPLSRAIETLKSILLIHPVQGNLVIPPKCTEYTYGTNEGKCIRPLPSQDDYECGEFGIIPLSYIGTREVCISSYGSCTTEGPDGPGLPNADYLLFVSAYSTCELCLLMHYSYTFVTMYVYVYMTMQVVNFVNLTIKTRIHSYIHRYKHEKPPH